MALEKGAADLYAEHVQHGPTGKGLMISHEGHYLGRAAIARGMVAVLEPASVLDVGCGYGDLIGGLSPDTHYEGVDYTAWIVAEARRRHPQRMFHEMSFSAFDPEGRTYELVAALGVLATIEPANRVAFARRLLQLSTAWILVSYLEAGSYAGRMHACSLNDLEILLAPWLPLTRPVAALGDPSNKTVLFRRPGF